jgi:hypothetical protein
MFILPKVTVKLDWDPYRLLQMPDRRDAGTASIANNKKKIDKTVIIIKGTLLHLHLGDRMVSIRNICCNIINTKYSFYPRSVIHKKCNTSFSLKIITINGFTQFFLLM